MSYFTEILVFKGTKCAKFSFLKKIQYHFGQDIIVGK